MDDEGRRARPIKGSRSWGPPDSPSDISLTRCANVQQNRRHARADALTLRQKVSGFVRDVFCFSCLGVFYLSHGKGKREGCSGENSGGKPGGRTWGEGGGAVGDSGGDLFGDFNFLFFSLAVT